MNAGQMETGPNTDEARSESVKDDDDAAGEEDEQLGERRPRVGKRPYTPRKLRWKSTCLSTSTTGHGARTVARAGLFRDSIEGSMPKRSR